ncbi:hypothetical protein Pelo_10441 [Pelomyxa schiedti]|nr:hypothetical protein Pelo_10441 [Pelomyxa schiedti]
MAAAATMAAVSSVVDLAPTIVKLITTVSTMCITSSKLAGSLSTVVDDLHSMQLLVERFSAECPEVQSIVEPKFRAWVSDAEAVIESLGPSCWVKPAEGVTGAIGTVVMEGTASDKFWKVWAVLTSEFTKRKIASLHKRVKEFQTTLEVEATIDLVRSSRAIGAHLSGKTYADLIPNVRARELWVKCARKDEIRLPLFILLLQREVPGASVTQCTSLLNWVNSGEESNVVTVESYVIATRDVDLVTILETWLEHPELESVEAVIPVAQTRTPPLSTLSQPQLRAKLETTPSHTEPPPSPPTDVPSTDPSPPSYLQVLESKRVITTGNAIQQVSCGDVPTMHVINMVTSTAIPFYFEVYVKNAGSTEDLSIGVVPATAGFDLVTDHPGKKLGIGYHSRTGSSFVLGNTNSYAESWAQGDVIGCGFDVEARAVFFTKNGISQGWAHHVGENPVNFFPAIGLNSLGSEIVLNLGTAKFLYVPALRRTFPEEASGQFCPQGHVLCTLQEAPPPNITKCSYCSTSKYKPVQCCSVIGCNYALCTGCTTLQLRKCPKNHLMFAAGLSTLSSEGYTNWKCNLCGKQDSSLVMHCDVCHYDVCMSCMKEEAMRRKGVGAVAYKLVTWAVNRYL